MIDITVLAYIIIYEIIGYSMYQFTLRQADKKNLSTDEIKRINTFAFAIIAFWPIIFLVTLFRLCVDIYGGIR